MASQPSFRGSSSRTERPGKVGRGFWHRPWLMNIVSDVLLLLVSVAIGYAGLKAVLSSPLFSLKEVVVTTPLKQVTAAQIEYAASSLRGNFFTVDLEQARQTFEKLPWVRHAQLRRQWPGTIEVELEEYDAVAYWQDVDADDTRLLDTQGNVFEGTSGADMPVFSGPPDYAPMMLEKLKSMDAQLKPLGRQIAKLTLSNRMAWQLKLDDGLIIELGREQEQLPLKRRLDRFVAAYPQTLVKFDTKIKVADLRYPSGFAVRLAVPDSSPKPSDSVRRSTGSASRAGAATRRH